MLTMGGDFQFQNALQNYKNMDKLIHYVNRLVSALAVKYSTMNPKLRTIEK